MTDIAASPPRESSLTALFKHARYVLGENPVTGFAFALFVLIVLAAVFGPHIVPYDPLASDTTQALKPPNMHHWFGTDQLGRDVFSRVVVATRLDFFIAVASVALVFLMGGLAGVAAGFFGGWTDRIVGRIADTIMAFPLFVLAMGIVAALGNTVQNIVLATAIVNFPLYARIARAEANIRRDAGFVEAARLSGNSDWRILAFQILPNVFPILVVQMSLTMGYAILNAAGLSFIGLGVRPPTPEWGIMVAEGAAFMVSGEWWNAIVPRRGADGRGVLLQSARRRIARHGRSQETDMTAADTTISQMNQAPALSVEGLCVEFRTRSGIVRALDNVELQRRQGRDHRAGRRIRLRQIGHRLCGDGHSRSRRPRHRPDEPCSAGSIFSHATPSQLAEVRGRDIAMIFQNPRTALNPIRPVGRQIADVLIRHGNVPRREAPEQAVEMLRAVGITDPARRAKAYPFEMSGGMCQRVMIAIALAAKPSLLIADEPTTGLDVTTQAVIMDLINDLAEQDGHGDDLHHPRSGARRPALGAHRRHACRPRRRERADQGTVRASAPSLYGRTHRRDAGFRGEPR